MKDYNELTQATQELTHLCREIDNLDLDRSEEILDVLLRMEEMIEDEEEHLRELFGIVS